MPLPDCKFCRRCNNSLPPPGQRFVTHCPTCSVDLPVPTLEGNCLVDHCPECGIKVPLLQPTSAASAAEANTNNIEGPYAKLG